MKKMSIIKKSLNVLCSFLIALTPVILVETNCFFLWGEVECPEALKELY